MYSVVVVDDEEIARLRLRRLLLENFSNFKIVAEVANGNAAAEIIRTTKPDLVFLDIEMPGISGVEIARTYCEDIFVVFITAHDQYVFDAFKTLAVAYILKPLELKELCEAIGKFKKIVTPATSKKVAGPAVKQDFPSVRSEHLKVSIGNTTKFILFDDIIYFEANQKYTITFTSNLKNYIVDRTLLELEEMLRGTEFIRIHRKYIVNRTYISEIRRIGDRKFKVLLKMSVEKELLAGRHYLANLKYLQ